jgi:deazaflavin-dependent oxidoreductase (nitroreductase family)
MAKTYQVRPITRVVNQIVKAFIRLGIGPSYVLTVPGRKSGKSYSTPVTLVEENGERWLVAPYGDVAWVRNARVTGQVTLTRKQRSEIVSITELAPAESAPVLKLYVTRVPITQPYFDATPDSALSAFEAEAPHHPVFHIRGKN